MMQVPGTRRPCRATWCRAPVALISALRSWRRRHTSRRGVRPRSRRRCFPTNASATGRFVLQAALDGAGFASLSDAAVRPHLDSGRLVRVLQRHSPRFGGHQLFHPSGRLVRAGLRAFMAIVKEKRRWESPALTP
ncbi:LysR substrate-binding domain-containing protein [Stigmatella aurantiaca]